MKIKDLIVKELKGLWGEEPKQGEENIPIIKTNNLSYEGKINFNNITYRFIEKHNVIGNKLIYGDLLIEKSGGTKSHSVGYVNFFESENEKYVCNNFILALRPNKNLVIPKYLFYNLKFFYESGFFSDCYNKTTGIQNLKKEKYLNKEIKIYNLETQKEIVTFLDMITNNLSVAKNRLFILDELIKSRFIKQEAFAC